MFRGCSARFPLRATSLVALLALVALFLQSHFGSISVPTRAAAIAKAKAVATHDRTGFDLALKKAIEHPLAYYAVSLVGFAHHQTLRSWLTVASHLIRSPPITTLR
jgi:hypothetical protein